jgi:hypothetical protein
LLEVTLALAIMAVAFTALSVLQSRNLTLAAEGLAITRATLASRDLLARILSGALPVQSADGEMGPDHPGWRWAIRVREEAGSSLRRVDMLVFEERAGPEKGFSFFLLLRKEREERL